MQLELLVRGISLAAAASEPHSTVVHNSRGRRERLRAVWLNQVCAWLMLWAVGSCEGWCNNSKPDREDIPKIGGRSSNRMQHRSPRTGIYEGAAFLPVLKNQQHLRTVDLARRAP